MASKKQKFDNYDFDSELDFDLDDLLGDIDSGFSSEAKDKDSRNPVKRAFTGAVSGLKTAATDKDIITQLLRDALPAEYDRSATMIGDASDNIRGIFREAVTELKPAATGIAREVDKLIPSERKRLKSISERIKEKLGIQNEDRGSQYKTGSTEQSINGNLDAIFGQQNQQRAEDKVTDKIKSVIDAKRYKSQMGVFNDIAGSLGSIVTYNDRINIAYQRKSLELQYRSHYLQTELLATSKQYFEVFKGQNEAITKNTALPEFTKIQQSERFKEQMRTKFIDNIQSGLFGNGDWIRDGFADLRKKAANQVSGVKSGLEMGMMGLEMSNQMKEIAKETGMEIDGVHEAGAAGGNMLGQQIGSRLGQWGREKLEKNKAINKGGQKLLGLLSGGQNRLRDLAESKHLREDWMDGDLTFKAKEGIRSIISSFTKGPDVMLNRDRITNPDSPAVITEKFTNSVNIVIPGYLSRIYRELRILRTGDEKTELVTYDTRRNEFVTQSNQTKGILKEVKKHANLDWFKYKQNYLVNHLIGDTKLSKSADKMLRDRLTDATFANKGLSKGQRGISLQDMLDPKFFKAELQKNPELVNEIMQAIQSTHQDTDKFDKANTDTILNMNAMSSSVADIRGVIERQQRATGIKPLIEAGLVKQDKQGNIKVDVERYKQLLMGNDDFTYQKKPTRRAGTGGKLSPYAGANQDNTDIIQDLQPAIQSLGSISLDRVESLLEQIANKDCCEDKESDQFQTINSRMDTIIEQLGVIAQNTLEVNVNVGSLGGSTEGSPSRSKSWLQQTGDGIWGAAKWAGRTGKKIYDNEVKLLKGAKRLVGAPVRFGARQAGKALYKINRLFKKGKNDDEEGEEPEFTGTLGNSAKHILSQGFSLVGNVFGFAKDKVLKVTKALPAGYAQIASALGWVGGKAIGGIRNYMNRPRDIYVPGDPPDENGNPKPRLTAIKMLAGEYFDEKGMVISSPLQIRGVVKDRDGNIVLSFDDIKKGLIDASGKKIQGLFGSALGLAKKAVMAPLRAGKAIATTSFNMLKKTLTGAGRLAEAALSKTGFKNFFDSEGGFNFGFASNRQVVLLEEIKSILLDRLPASKRKILGDKDGDGDRDNSWQDILSRRKGKKKKDNKPVSPEERFKGPGLFGMFGSLLSSAGSMIGSVFSKIGDLGSLLLGKDMLKGLGGMLLKHLPGKILGGLSGLLSSFLPSMGGGLLKGTGTLLGSAARGAGTLLGAAGRGIGALATGGLSAARTVGTGLIGLGRGAVSALGAGSTVARIAGVANTARNVLMAGSLVSGGAGGMLAGALGTAGTAIGAVLTSPVALGVGALALAGYGGYKAYKYFTRDNASKLTAFRLKQYGLTEVDKDSYHTLFELEDYLETEAVGYENNVAKILPSKVSVEKIMSIFSINPDDQQATQKLVTWFDQRFKPIFLTHQTALYAIDSKMTLKDIDKLSDEQKLKYINAAAYENGPYNVTTSPFQNVTELSARWLDVKSALTELRNELKPKADKQATKIQNLEALKDSKTYESYAVNSDVAKYGKMVKLADAEAEQNKKEEKSWWQKTKDWFSGGDDNTNTGSLGSAAGATNNDMPIDSDSPPSPALPGQDNRPQPVDAKPVPMMPGNLSDGKDGERFIRKGNKGVHFDTMHPLFKRLFFGAVQEYGEKTGKTVQVNSGSRTHEEQAAQYRKDPSKAAKPYSSMHEFGLAVDANSADLDAMEKMGIMRKYGLTRPIGGETWHVEPAGVQQDYRMAKVNGKYATWAISMSPGRGGGGAGVTPGQRKKSRNRDLQLKLLGQDMGKYVNGSEPQLEGNLIKPSTDSGGYMKAEYTTGPNQQDTNTGSLGSTTNTTRYASSGFRDNTTPTDTATDGYVNNEPETESYSDTGTNTGGKYGKILDIIAKAAAKVSVPVKSLQAMAAIESSLNPNAKAGSSSAAGLFQHIASTWQAQKAKYGKRYGVPSNASPFNPEYSAILGATYLKENMDYIKSVKSNPSPVDGYLAHFLGAGGAKTFLRAMAADPNTIGAELMPKAAKANKNIFWTKGRPNTLRDIYAMLTRKMSDRAKEFGISIGNTTSSGKSESDFVPNTQSPSLIKASVKPSDQAGIQTAEYSPSTDPKPSLYSPSLASSAVSSGYEYQSRMEPSSNGLGNIPDTLGNIDSTLTKSLDVQTNILKLLQKIADKNGTGVSKLDTVPDKIQPTPDKRSVKPAPASAVNMKRA